MNLGVDACRIHGHTGVPRYITNVISGWSASGDIGTFNKATIYTPKKIDDSRLSLNSPLEEKLLPSDSRQLVWQNTTLARACDSDVLWCPAYVTPLSCSARIVVTTHDATNAIHPELYSYADRIFYRHFYAWCARRATLVITNNKQTCEDIVKYYGVSREKMRIVPLAPAQIFEKLHDESVVAETCLRLIGDDRPYFLSVGKISTRRNVPVIIEGFARFKEKSGLAHRLVIVGRGGTDINIRELAVSTGLADDLVNIEYVTDEELVHLYNGTQGFVTAATYEANSFTTVEAQVCGAPVVIPDVPGMQQMTNGIAVVMPRVGAREISEALELLGTDDNLRRRLSEEGQGYASGFSWEQTSRGIISVLEEAAVPD